MSVKLRVATFLAPNMFPVYEFLVDALGRALGSHAELVSAHRSISSATARLMPGSSAACHTFSS
jgi:hypothetical protein